MIYDITFTHYMQKFQSCTPKLILQFSFALNTCMNKGFNNITTNNILRTIT